MPLDKETQPLIQIVIPVYNVGDFLDSCLESIHNQTYTHWEALMVEDASPDQGRCLSICRKWEEADHRFKLTALPKNGGVSHARNVALKQLTAPYVTFVDSDDFLSPLHLETLVDTLLSYDADVSVCGINHCYANGRFRNREFGAYKGRTWQQPAIVRYTIMDKLSGHPCNKLFKRSVLQGIFFPEGRVFEDFVWILPVMERASKVVHTGTHTYYYRRHAASTTKHPSPRNAYHLFWANMERWEYLQNEHPLLSATDRKRLSMWPLKGMYNRRYALAHRLPNSPEQAQYLDEANRHFVRLGIPFIRRFHRLRMFLFSLYKHYCRFIYR